MSDLSGQELAAGCGCGAIVLLLSGVAFGFFGRIAWATLKAGWYLAEELL